MNKPTSAVKVDAERLVRDLLNAFSSLNAIPAPATGAAASPAEQPLQPALKQEVRDRAAEHGEELAVSIPAPAESRPEPQPPRETLTEPRSDIGEQEKLVPKFQWADSCPSSSDRIEAPKTQQELIDEFRADREVLQRFEVTPEELHALSRVSMLGIMTSKQDLLFILRQIRDAANPNIPEGVDLPEPELIDVPEKTPEPPPSVTAQMTEHIRREALLKLPVWQKQRDAERRRAQLGLFLSAIGSVAAKAGRRAITLMS